MAGHASGTLRFWELKTQGGGGGGGGVVWCLAKAVGGVHAAAVTACAVLDGGAGATWALSADAHGRLMCHNVHRHLSLAAQALAGFARERRRRGTLRAHGRPLRFYAPRACLHATRA